MALWPTFMLSVCFSVHLTGCLIATVLMNRRTPLYLPELCQARKYEICVKLKEFVLVTKCLKEMTRSQAKPQKRVAVCLWTGLNWKRLLPVCGPILSSSQSSRRSPACGPPPAPFTPEMLSVGGQDSVTASSQWAASSVTAENNGSCVFPWVHELSETHQSTWEDQPILNQTCPTAPVFSMCAHPVNHILAHFNQLNVNQTV